MKNLFISVIAAIALTSCSHSLKRDPAHNGAHDGPEKVMTAESLFMKGKFMTKKHVITHEDHYGEELDLSVRRPVVNVTNSVLTNRFAVGGYMLIANFFYKGKFWIARVPSMGGIKNLYFQLVHFPPEFIAAHSMLRFEMDPNTPVQLVAEMPSLEQVEAPGFDWNSMKALENPIKIFNVVMSAEAQWTKNDKKKEYNLLRGNRGAFIQIIRLTSAEDRFREFYDNGSPVSQLKLDSYGTAGVLAKAIERSEQDGISKIYSTWNYNCTTIAFDIYEQASGKKDDRIGVIRERMDKRVPVLSPNQISRFGGEETTKMHLDPSLVAESKAAYASVYAPTRPLCKAGIKKDNCNNIKEGLKTIGL